VQRRVAGAIVIVLPRRTASHNTDGPMAGRRHKSAPCGGAQPRQPGPPQVTYILFARSVHAGQRRTR
jgi:hypothetical protein